MSQHETIAPHLDSIKKNVTISETCKEKTQAHFELAEYYYYFGEHNLSIAHSLKTIASFCSKADKAQKNIETQTYNIIGSNYALIGLFNQSTQYFIQSLELAQFEKDTLSMLSAMLNIGINFYELKDYKSASYYYSKCQNLPKSGSLVDSGFLATLYNHIGLVNMSESEFEKSENSLRKALGFACNWQNKSIRSEIYFSLTDLYLRQKTLQKAQIALDSAQQIQEQTEDPYLKILFNHYSARLALTSGNFEAATAHAKTAYKWADSLLYLSQQISAMENLVSVADSMKDYRQYFHYTIILDSISNRNKKSNQINDLNELLMKQQLRLEEKNKNDEIELLKNENTLNNYRNASIFITAIIIALIILFVAMTSNYNRKLEEAELNKETINNQILNEQIKEKNNELMKFNEFLNKKNQILDQAKLELANIKTNFPEIDLRPLSNTLKQHLVESKEKIETHDVTEDLHQNFFYQLDKNYPNLSTKDKRLCLLIVQHYSSKEIAHIFNIALGSVEKRRHRLRKKMNITTNEPIADVLQNLI